MAEKGLIEKVKEMMAAPSCCAALKEKAQTWLDRQDAASAKAMLAEIEADVTTIDGLVAFTESPHCAEVLGAEAARQLAAHAKEIRSKGAKWCDCAACAAGLEILAVKEELLK